MKNLSFEIPRALTCLANDICVCPDLQCSFYDSEMKRCHAHSREFYALIAYQIGCLEGQHMKDRKLITGMLAAVREFLDGITHSVEWTEDTRSRFKTFEGLVDKYEAAIAAEDTEDGWKEPEKSFEQVMTNFAQQFKNVRDLIDHIQGGQ